MTTTQGLARKWLVGTIVAATATAGLIVGVAGPASADPMTSLVGVGSDTTQDVMDAISLQVGGGLLGSWDAVDPVTKAAGGQIAPKPGCTMTRPNGSGQGLNALRKSINPNTTAPQLADAPEPGCVDWARSSSGPSTANASPTGDLVYVPFALDAVATATGPATAVTGTDPAVATNIKDADLFTKTDLQNMYDTCTPVTPAGSTVSYVPDGTVTDATHQPIHLYIPQAGSGTRSFWLSTLNVPATLPPCLHDTIVGTTTIVEEHDGTVYAQDADAFGPFSIAQWVAQKNGHNDRRHNAVLHNLNGVAPLTAGGTLNSAYPITREVYNIVSFARVTSTANADKQFVAQFSGSGSAVCSNAITILNLGFALLTSAPLGHTCGQVATNLRAFDPATNPV
jgi:ABC-type phosphate transport system substrate-binding protein